MQNTMKLKFKDGKEVIVPDNNFNREFFSRNYNGLYTIEKIEQKKEPEKKQEIVENSELTNKTTTGESASNEVAPNGTHSQTATLRRGRPSQKQTDEF